MSHSAYVFLMILGFASLANAQTDVPRVRFQYSFALDMFCPETVVPETLTADQRALIAKIPVYRNDLLANIETFQKAWDEQGVPLLRTARSIVGKPFAMSDLQASLFLCPRLPSMGTPLALNVISYVSSASKDLPSLAGRPLPVFFFVSTTFHEILHKYVDDALAKRPSAILLRTIEPDLYEAHLHVFALQKAVFESLGLSSLLLQVRALEATHGPEYVRAWNAVHGDSKLYTELIRELR